MFRHLWKDLVNGTLDFVAAERRDHSFDLPPMAEAGDIAVVAAALRAHRRLEPGVVAITRDQVRSVVQRHAPMDEGVFHARFLARPRFPTADDRRQHAISHLWWPAAPSSAMARRCQALHAPEDASSPSAFSPGFR